MRLYDFPSLRAAVHEALERGAPSRVAMVREVLGELGARLRWSYDEPRRCGSKCHVTRRSGHAIVRCVRLEGHRGQHAHRAWLWRS